MTVVEQFGHFPHRNEIMGRESTPEEVKFLNDPAFRFDLPLVIKEDGTVTFAPTDEFNNRNFHNSQLFKQSTISWNKTMFMIPYDKCLVYYAMNL